MLPRLLRRATSHRGIAAAAGVAAAGAAWAAPSLCERPPPAAPPVAPSDLPIYSKAEVAKHKTAENGIWVIFQGNVYDITQFVENHPGGIEKIMTAAGGDVEPYWSLYRQHLKPASGGAFDPKEHVGEILQPLLIGHIDPAEVAAAKKNAKPGAPTTRFPAPRGSLDSSPTTSTHTIRARAASYPNANECAADCSTASAWQLTTRTRTSRSGTERCA